MHKRSGLCFKPAFANTHQASDFSITSGLTNASKHWARETLLIPRPVGIGRDRYMNEL